MSAAAPRSSLVRSIAGALGLVLVMAVIASCLIGRKSSGYECSTDDECDSGRICDQGYCVAAQCPAACNNGCDLVTKTCNIRCEQPGNRCSGVDCPSGYACSISCSGNGACSGVVCPAGARSCTINCATANACGAIQCAAGAPCTFNCATANACGNITCGASAACNVTCTGTDACGTVSCQNSCACDVTCTTGSCDTLSCPVKGGTACTKSGSLECSSTTSAACSTCPL